MPKNAGFAFAHGGGVFGVVLCVFVWCVEWGLVCVCVVGVGFERNVVVVKRVFVVCFDIHVLDVFVSLLLHILFSPSL